MDYEGPGGIRTALVFLCQKLSLDMAVLHARVTYYPEFNMVIAHNPKSIRALVRRLNRILRLDLDLGDLDRETRDFEARMGYFALQNREFRTYVEALEKEYSAAGGDDGSDLSADEAVQAAEEFLRRGTDREA